MTLAALEALAQFVENEECNDEYDDPSGESPHPCVLVTRTGIALVMPFRQ